MTPESWVSDHLCSSPLLRETPGFLIRLTRARCAWRDGLALPVNIKESADRFRNRVDAPIPNRRFGHGVQGLRGQHHGCRGMPDGGDSVHSTENQAALRKARSSQKLFGVAEGRDE